MTAILLFILGNMIVVTLKYLNKTKWNFYLIWISMERYSVKWDHKVFPLHVTSLFHCRTLHLTSKSKQKKHSKILCLMFLRYSIYVGVCHWRLPAFHQGYHLVFELLLQWSWRGLLPAMGMMNIYRIRKSNLYYQIILWVWACWNISYKTKSDT